MQHITKLLSLNKYCINSESILVLQLIKDKQSHCQKTHLHIIYMTMTTLLGTHQK